MHCILIIKHTILTSLSTKHFLATLLVVFVLGIRLLDSFLVCYPCNLHFKDLHAAFICTPLKQKCMCILSLFVSSLWLLHSLTTISKSNILSSYIHKSCPHIQYALKHSHTAVCYSNAAVFNSAKRHQRVLRDVSGRESE